jgi:hypothetical protein
MTPPRAGVLVLHLVAAACAPAAASRAGFVRVSELPSYRGQPTFRIETGRGAATLVTYYYHRRGAGFASLIDRDGKDWITWRPGGGPEGEFRGVPNLGLERCCHPGYTDMTSEVVSTSPARAVIRSRGAGGFEVSWEITPAHATLTVVRAPKTYWFLYEGTPGGALEPGDELVFLSDGRRIPITTGKHGGDMPDPEWIYIADGQLDRALFFAHHESDGAPETYFRMGAGSGGMTVWGFGRGPGTSTHLSGTHRLTLGLVDSRDPAVIRAAVGAAVTAAR